MPNYQTHFCAALYVPSVMDFREVHKIYDAFYEESESHGHELEFSVTYVSVPKPHLLLTDNEGTGTIEHVRAFVFEVAKALALKGTWALQWAETSLRPRVDGYGGGVILLDLAARTTLFYDSTHAWLEDQVAVDQNAAADEGFDWRTRQLEKVLSDLFDLAQQVSAQGAILRGGTAMDAGDFDRWMAGVSALQARANLASEALMRRHRAAKDLLDVARAVLGTGIVQPVFNAFVVTNDRHRDLGEPEIITRLRQAVAQLDGH